MELWRGTLPSHSAIAYTAATEAARAALRFDDEFRWSRYVPVRLPGTLCIVERLPPGAAAVLLSRYHSSPDLIVPIDAVEKRLFDAIDGRRSIEQIAEIAGGQELAQRARTFFEKLYWFDQVAVDASPAQ
jgi:hypothetical protein